jgi:sulfide dehydrogenase [flavocytochrome c] flavoprotein subunit
VTGLSRRDLIKRLRDLGVLSVSGSIAVPLVARAESKANVVIIGGGFGGATCARYLQRYDPSILVTLIEPKARYITCPFSNTVLAGTNQMDFITHDYKNLAATQNIRVLQDEAVEVDVASKRVITRNRMSLPFDHLVVSPGIDFRWDAIEGYDEELSQRIPHAWQAGVQTEILRNQLEAMADGGVVIISTPAGQYRAPPAAYERASMIAYYLQKHKSKSKVLVLDSQAGFEEYDLYKHAWDQLYPGMIEWIGSSEVTKLNIDTMTLKTKEGASHQGDVINIIPPQQAGKIAFITGLTDKDGWCPVDQRSFESVNHKTIHVIGDSCIPGEMAKAGSAANTQAKACAAAIVANVTGSKLPNPIFMDVFYGLIGKKHAISNVNVYKLIDGLIKKTSGGLSSIHASDMVRFKEVIYAEAWYKSITSDAFG